MGRRSLISMLYSLLKSIIGPIMVFFGYGVVGAAIGYSSSFLITGVFAVSLVVLNLRNLPKSPIPISVFISDIFHYSYPLFFSRLFAGSLVQVFNFIFVYAFLGIDILP